MDNQIETILSELRRNYEALYGDRLVRLVLFGSHARGDASPGSDIDIAAVLRGPVDPCTEIQRTTSLDAELCLKYNVVVATVFVSERDFIGKDGPLLRNIRREGVAV